MLKHIPNILTIIRLILIPIIFIFAMQGNYFIAIVLLVLSGITDVLDGFIARKFNLISTLGTLLDPLADKLTQISTLLVLVLQNIIPLWILIILLLKEISMIIGATFLFKKETVAIPSKWYGKTATVLFYVAIFFSMLKKQFAFDYTFDLYLYYIALFFAVFALIMYFRIFNEKRKKSE